MSQENVEVVRRWWAAFNKDGTPPLELCHERIEIRNPASFPNRGPYRGHDGVHDWMADTWDVIDDHHIEVDEVIDVGDGELELLSERAREGSISAAIALERALRAAPKSDQ